MDWAKIVCGKHDRSFLEWQEKETGPQATKFSVACRACGGTIIHHATFAEAEQFAENVSDMNICTTGGVTFDDYFKGDWQTGKTSKATIPAWKFKLTLSEQ